jgi:hypothetical protein
MSRSGQGTAKRTAKRRSLPRARGAGHSNGGETKGAKPARDASGDIAELERVQREGAGEIAELAELGINRRTIEGLLGPRAAAKRRAAKAEREGEAASAAQADLSRMISELNEVRMRLDAIVRRLASNAVEVPESSESVADVEQLRMRLLGKLDRIREQLVTRLSEERAGARDR